MELDRASNNNSTTAVADNNVTLMATNSLLKSSYDTDVVRLIGQHLLDLGLRQTADLLLEESGLHQFDHPTATQFKENILSGDWDKANQLVEEVANLSLRSSSTSSSTIYTNSNQSSVQNTVQVANKQQQNGCNSSATPVTNSSIINSDLEQQRRTNIDAVRLAIAEQKFLESIEDNERIKALRCLRCEITPICKDVNRIQLLTTLLMCKSIDEIRSRISWHGKSRQSRQAFFEKLRYFIPPAFMLPPKRLETLLNQAVQLQRERCVLHLRRIHPSSQQPQASTITRWTNRLAPLSEGPSYYYKKNSVATIISDNGYLGCNGCCERLAYRQRRHQRSTSAARHSPDVNMMSPLETTCSNNNTLDTCDSTNDDEAQSSAGDNELDHSRSDEDSVNDHHQIDLKSDHVCLADKFPLRTKQQLTSHKNEVWFCKFSNDGTRLATGGLGGKIKIWNLDHNKREFVEKCALDCSGMPISCLSWSPNDFYLLACGSEDEPDLLIWNVKAEQTHRIIITRLDDESFTTCSWHPGGERFAAASLKGTFNIYDLDGNKCGSREGIRVQCVSFLNKDPNLLLAADALNRIKSYKVRCDSTSDVLSLNSEEDEVLWERYSITTFVVDQEDKYIAVNIMEQGIHLWDFRRRTLLRVFLGVSQRNLTIYSSFSSPDSTFLASGSEDGKVYIYHIEKDEPVAILNGHDRCVNCVTWNPKFPDLLASASDDRSVRLWAPVDSTQSYHVCQLLSH